jgi:hypothetical protein
VLGAKQDHQPRFGTGVKKVGGVPERPIDRCGIGNEPQSFSPNAIQLVVEYTFESGYYRHGEPRDVVVKPVVDASASHFQLPPKLGSARIKKPIRRRLPMTDAPEKKKGTHPLVWVAVGCAGIIMLGVFVLVVGLFFVFNTAKDVAQGLDENPVVAMARVVAATNPEIELIEADEESRVVTFRNTRTDEVYTIDFEDIEEGRISFHSDDESVSLELEKDDDEEGRLTVRTDDGTASFGGGVDMRNMPSWIPVYPGTTPKGTFSTESEEGRSGAYTISTEDDVEDVLDYFVRELEGRGLEIVNRATSNEGAFLMAKSPDENLTINLAASVEDGTTRVVVNFNEK